MSQRAYTLQDVIAGLQRQINRVASPPTDGAVLLDVLAADDESFGTSDTDTVQALAGDTTWGGVNATMSGNEITDLMRANALAWTTSQSGGGQTDGLGLYRNLAWANYRADPIASGTLLTNAGVAMTRTALGGGKYRLTNSVGDGLTRILRIFVNLADLQNGATYTCSVYYANVTGQNAESDWCDTAAQTITVGSSGRFVNSQSRATYTSVYRFFDIQVSDGGSIDVWSAQVEDGATVHDYVAASFGMTKPNGVFIGRAATNLFRRGQCDSIADSWNLAPPAGASQSIDATVAAPFSPQSIKYVTDGTAANQGCSATSATGQAAAPGTVAAGSIWFKGTAGHSFDVWLRWGNTDASVTDGAHTVVIATGSWQQVTPATLAVAAGKTGDYIQLFVRTSATSAETFWAAHAMIEKGQSVVAPYVPTSGGATATKNAARVQFPASLLDETQGWIAMRFRLGFSMSQVSSSPTYIPSFFQWADSGNAQLRLTTSPGGGGSFQALRWNAGNIGGPTVVSTHVAGDHVTLIMSWTSTRVYLSVDGAAPYTDGVGPAIPTLNATLFDIGTDQVSGRWADSQDIWTVCGLGTISAADASALFALGDTIPTAANLAPTTKPTAIWSAVDGTLTYLGAWNQGVWS